MTLFLSNLLLISIILKYKKWSLFSHFFELKIGKLWPNFSVYHILKKMCYLNYCLFDAIKGNVVFWCFFDIISVQFTANFHHFKAQKWSLFQSLFWAKNWKIMAEFTGIPYLTKACYNLGVFLHYLIQFTANLHHLKARKWELSVTF